jgi:hypothetical protein
METLQVFALACTDPECSFRRSGIVTPEYANTLAIQHHFRYGHRVEVTQ